MTIDTDGTDYALWAAEGHPPATEPGPADDDDWDARMERKHYYTMQAFYLAHSLQQSIGRLRCPPSC